MAAPIAAGFLPVIVMPTAARLRWETARDGRGQAVAEGNIRDGGNLPTGGADAIHAGSGMEHLFHAVLDVEHCALRRIGRYLDAMPIIAADQQAAQHPRGNAMADRQHRPRRIEPCQPVGKPRRNGGEPFAIGRRDREQALSGIDDRTGFGDDVSVVSPLPVTDIDFQQARIGAPVEERSIQMLADDCCSLLGTA